MSDMKPHPPAGAERFVVRSEPAVVLSRERFSPLATRPVVEAARNALEALRTTASEDVFSAIDPALMRSPGAPRLDAKSSVEVSRTLSVAEDGEPSRTALAAVTVELVRSRRDRKSVV